MYSLDVIATCTIKVVSSAYVSATDQSELVGKIKSHCNISTYQNGNIFSRELYETLSKDLYQIDFSTCIT